MNNVTAQPAAALKALFAAADDSDASRTIDRFATAFAQHAADKASEIEKTDVNDSDKLAALTLHILELATAQGWTVSASFAATFAQCVIALLVGVRVVEPTSGLNTLAP